MRGKDKNRGRKNDKSQSTKTSMSTVDAGYKNIVGNCIQCSYNRYVGYNGYRLLDYSWSRKYIFV